MKRTIAVIVCTAGLLAGSAAPTPANGITKFQGTIAAPAPGIANALAASYYTDAARLTCPDPGEGDGQVYKFFDLKAEYKHFYVSGPNPVVNQPDPTGVYGGTWHDYDLDLYVFNSKCAEVDGEGPINEQNGIGTFTAAKPVRYAAIAYYSGPYANIPVTLEASNAKIKK